MFVRHLNRRASYAAGFLSVELRGEVRTRDRNFMSRAEKMVIEAKGLAESTERENGEGDL